MRATLFLLLISCMPLSSFSRDRFCDDSHLGFLSSLPYRAYSFTYPTRDKNWHDYLYHFATLKQLDCPGPDSTSCRYLYIESRIRLDLQDYFNLIPYGKDSCNYAASRYILPNRDTVSLWSNDKPQARTLKEVQSLDPVFRTYGELVRQYRHESLMRRDFYYELRSYTAFMAVPTVAGICLLTSDDTRVQNAGGILLGMGSLAMISVVIDLFKKPKRWKHLGRLKEKICSWDERDTQNVLNNPDANPLRDILTEEN